jgi:hypothetical protein
LAAAARATLAAAVILICCSFALAAGTSYVKITKGTVKTEVAIDHLPRRFTGKTEWHFECRPDFYYERLPAKPNEAKLKITGASMKIGLNIWQILPVKRTTKLEQHENGHEQICKQIYATAEKYARESCAQAIGRTFTGTGKNEKEALDKATDEASRFVSEKYAERTGKYCDAVSAWYDSLTDHGFNKITEKKAITEAFKKVGPQRP